MNNKYLATNHDFSEVKLRNGRFSLIREVRSPPNLQIGAP